MIHGNSYETDPNLSTEDQLKNDIAANRVTLKLGEALERLQKNPDYQLVISTHYQTTRALELVSMLKADSASEPTRQACREKLDAISLFGEFIRVVTLQGNAARKTIEDAQTALDEIRGE